MDSAQANDIYLGIDGGGTKTEAVIGTADGQVISRGLSGGANHHNLGLTEVYSNIAAAVKSAAAAALQQGVAVNVMDFKSICIGLSGIDVPSDRQRLADYFREMPMEERSFSGSRLTLCPDGFIGLKSAANENWGICLIASTGCNCFGMNQAGQEATAGDWGYILGDRGSGYAIGLKMLQQVVKEADGRAMPSPLTPAVLNHLGLRTPADLIGWVYADSIPVAKIASLAHLLGQSQLDSAAVLTFYTADVLTELMQSYRAVIQRLELKSSPVPVVLVGGLFKSLPFFTDAVKQLILKYTPSAEVRSSRQTPGEGALRAAGMAVSTTAVGSSVMLRVDTYGA